MSEKGCLLSKSFNTLNVSNQVEAKNLFTKNHIKASLHITRDTGGAIMKDQKDIFQLRNMNPLDELPNTTTIAIPVSQQTIAFPPKSIIESISIVLKRDNYIVHNLTSTDLAFRVRISDDGGDSYHDLLEESAAGGSNILLLPGKRTTDGSVDVGSFISINTIIPIISNYRLNDKLDKIRAVHTAGYVITDNTDKAVLSLVSGTEGNANAVPRPLYNESDTEKLIGIQLLTTGTTDPLEGFADDPGPTSRRPHHGMYWAVRTSSRSPNSPEYGGTFSALVTFTKLL